MSVINKIFSIRIIMLITLLSLVFGASSQEQEDMVIDQVDTGITNTTGPFDG